MGEWLGSSHSPPVLNAPPQAEWLSQTDSKCPCPGFRLSLSQDRWDPGDANRLKVDGGLFAEGSVPTDGRPHWDIQQGLLEFKSGKIKKDAYDDVKEGDADEKFCVGVRGQMTEYVGYAFANQHRTVMYFFLVNGPRVRVTRWDRSGTIFTEAIDYTKDPATLRDIMWGFSRLTPEERGEDETAEALNPSSTDYKKMDQVAAPNEDDVSEVEGTIVTEDGEFVCKFVRTLFADSIKDGAPRYRLYIPTADRKRRAFLVGRPIVVAPGMCGRGTRGFVAWDKTGERFVFLKDAWRPFYENVETEGRVLRKLAAAKVANVPTYVCDGELKHNTLTPNFAEKVASAKADEAEEAMNVDPDRPKTPERRYSKRLRSGKLVSAQGPSPNHLINRGRHIMRRLRHYRLVMEEVCMPLTEFKDGRQLVSVLRDCVQGTCCSP